MLTETFRTMAAATRNTLRNWPNMLLVAIVYAALLAVLYFFVIVREATVMQITLTFASGILAPLLFFVLQTMVANETDSLPVGTLLRKSLAEFWKVILVTLPLIAIAVLIIYLLTKAQVKFDTAVSLAPESLARRSRSAAEANSINWRTAMLSTIRYLSLGLLLPLAAIHLWLATVHDGLVAALKRIAAHLGRAFAPRSVLIYVIGFVVFAVIPYFLLFRTMPTSRAWLEISLLVLRLVVVFALTLFGWVITVRALAHFPRAEEPQTGGTA
jgi:hypothetical protein